MHKLKYPRLYCSIPQCTIPYDTVLSILYCIYTILYYLYYTVLYYAILSPYSIAQYSIVPYKVLYSVPYKVLYYRTLKVLYKTILYCTILHYTTRCNTSMYTHRLCTCTRRQYRVCRHRPQSLSLGTRPGTHKEHTRRKTKGTHTIALCILFGKRALLRRIIEGGRWVAELGPDPKRSNTKTRFGSR